jgi:Cu+-exporting ATPase
MLIKPEMMYARPLRIKRDGGGMAKDPVCGMMIDEKTAAGKSDYQGQTYYFCAPICKTRFDENPQKYLNKDR